MGGAAAGTMAADPCPLCASPLDPRRGFPVQGQRYMRCPGCEARVLTPLPDREALAAFYRDRYHALFGPAHDTARRHAMLGRLLARLPRRPPGRLLDVGCGGGHLLALARAKGWDVAGVDPATEAVARARVRYGLEVVPATLEEAGLPPACFDVVTLVNVLDQVPDPAALLAAARRALRPGGLLAARVPNGDFHRTAWGLIRRLPAPAASRLRPLVIFHHLSLNARALGSLLARAGFARVRVGNAPISGNEWSVPRGAGGRAALACLAVLARAAAGGAALATAGRLRWAPSLLAFAERGNA